MSDEQRRERWEDNVARSATGALITVQIAASCDLARAQPGSPLKEHERLHPLLTFPSLNEKLAFFLLTFGAVALYTSDGSADPPRGIEEHLAG